MTEQTERERIASNIVKKLGNIEHDINMLFTLNATLQKQVADMQEDAAVGRFLRETTKAVSVEIDNQRGRRFCQISVGTGTFEGWNNEWQKVGNTPFDCLRSAGESDIGDEPVPGGLT